MKKKAWLVAVLAALLLLAAGCGDKEQVSGGRRESDRRQETSEDDAGEDNDDEEADDDDAQTDDDAQADDSTAQPSGGMGQSGGGTTRPGNDTAQADDVIMQTNVTFVNDTGVDIYYLYASAADVDDWEEDLLDIDLLEYGEAFEVEFYYTADEMIWDFRIEDLQGNYLEFYDLDFAGCDGEGITIMLNDDGTAEIV